MVFVDVDEGVEVNDVFILSCPNNYTRKYAHLIFSDKSIKKSTKGVKWKMTLDRCSKKYRILWRILDIMIRLTL